MAITAFQRFYFGFGNVISFIEKFVISFKFPKYIFGVWSRFCYKYNALRIAIRAHYRLLPILILLLFNETFFLAEYWLIYSKQTHTNKQKQIFEKKLTFFSFYFSLTEIWSNFQFVSGNSWISANHNMHFNFINDLIFHFSLLIAFFAFPLLLCIQNAKRNFSQMFLHFRQTSEHGTSALKFTLVSLAVYFFLECPRQVHDCLSVELVALH